MTEDEARAWIAGKFGPESVEKLAEYERLLIAAAADHNLIAPSTIPAIWTRHFADSAQLIALAPGSGLWADIGSGAGLPGIVIALLCDRPVMLIEPRRLRVEFLLHCRNELGLSDRFSVVQAKVQNAQSPLASVISARAVARLDLLFAATRHIANVHTTYVLPKGRSAQSEVAAAKASWHGVFHVKQSLIDPESGIVVATGVSRR